MDLPNELYELDILDGSPPCSTFSMVGLREKSWGVNKKFREGQSEQILDTLFFDFIALAKKLKPKIVIAENVSGIRKGTSEQIYIPKIMKAFESAGYVIMCMAVNSAKLGVPQNRDRVFFFAVRSDLIQFINTVGFIKIPKPLSLPAFKNIPYNSIEEDKNGMFSYINKDSEFYKLWENTKCGNLFVDAYQRLNQTNKRVWFSQIKLHPDLICPTITSQLNYMTHYEVPRYISDLEIKRASSWPLDYDFLKQKVGYVCGMSVPPVMMAHVAHAVYNQWLIKIKENT
jgi:DNA (cytosine-5)-methyltransferase 1